MQFSAEKAVKENAKDLTGNATILLVEDEDAVRAFRITGAAIAWIHGA